MYTSFVFRAPLSVVLPASHHTLGHNPKFRNSFPCHTYKNRTRNSFSCHTSKKRVCKSFACHTFSNLNFAVLFWSGSPPVSQSHSPVLTRRLSALRPSRLRDLRASSLRELCVTPSLRLHSFALRSQKSKKSEPLTPFFSTRPLHSSSLFVTLKQINPVFATLSKSTPGYTHLRHHLGSKSPDSVSLCLCGESFLPSKQPRLPRRLARNLLQLRVLLPQRLRHLHLRLGQHADQLQRVHRPLALIMIVRNHINVPSRVRHFLHSRRPRPQLFLRVQIVVPFISRNRRVIAEPRVVPPPVQPHISHRPGRQRRRLQRFSNHRLVNVAKSRAALAQQFKNFRHIPRRVPHFHHQRIIRKPLQHSIQISQSFLSPVKRERELHQHRAKFSRAAQHIESRAHQLFILNTRIRIMCKSLPKLSGEQKRRVRRNPLHPQFRVVRPHRIVKTGIDFNRVEKFRQVGNFVKSLRLPRRIRVSTPIRIRPSRRPHSNRRSFLSHPPQPKFPRHALSTPPGIRSSSCSGGFIPPPSLSTFRLCSGPPAARMLAAVCSVAARLP